MNPLVVDTGSPPIPQVQAWRASYAGGFGPAIDLSQAVPGYPPHPSMLDRLAEAAGSPAAAQYGAILGDASLREAYAADLSAIYGGRVSADDVAITAGCNQAFSLAVSALAGPGDEVIVPLPYYFNHDMWLRLQGIRPVYLEPGPGLVHHSDRGTQYASNDYVRRLEESSMAVSMSRPARPWENAYCESFMQTLKSEEIDCRSYSTMEELARHIEEFIDHFYNRERLHSALDYLAPTVFEAIHSRPGAAAQQPQAPATTDCP